jgi:hypothetical protein
MTIRKYDSFEDMLEAYKEERANRPYYQKVWDGLGYYTWWAVYRFFTNRPWRKYIVHPWQRVTRGYDDTAHWSIDYHFVKVMLPAIKDLRKHTHGAPSTFVDFDATEEEQEAGWQAWLSTLDEMIEGFELINKIHDCGIFDTDYEEHIKDSGNEKLKKLYDEKWTIVNKEKHDRAFDLFKEHFYAMWD